MFQASTAPTSTNPNTTSPACRSRLRMEAAVPPAPWSSSLAPTRTPTLTRPSASTVAPRTFLSPARPFGRVVAAAKVAALLLPLPTPPLLLATLLLPPLRLRLLLRLPLPLPAALASLDSVEARTGPVPSAAVQAAASSPTTGTPSASKDRRPASISSPRSLGRRMAPLNIVSLHVYI